MKTRARFLVADDRRYHSEEPISAEGIFGKTLGSIAVNLLIFGLMFL